ncbi:MAG: DUF547 domain-containing protein [Planctomycetes bacterium]|nr:DUF547 domain-containing protein [Planctomycetota bacterium]
MKMNCFNQLKTPILVLGLWICLVSISSVHLTTAIAEEKTSQPNKKQVEPEAPNTTEAKETSKQKSDIFDLKLSTYILINEAYGRIFTPELITEEGLVKYSTLKRKRQDVITAKRELKKLNPAILMNLSKEERIAFWVNTYNFCTIKLILENYLIQPDGNYKIPPKWYMIIYPDNSIMQITGAWTKEFHEILREEYTLQEIEQDFLLKRYKDPRLCFALSNASVGGATLRNEPYQADHLDEQLDDQVKKYLNTEKGMRWDKDDNSLFLSNIFQIYKDTFLESDLAAIKKFRSRKDEERVWFNFITPYRSEEDVRHLEDAELRIRFIDFDWHLNEAQ